METWTLYTHGRLLDGFSEANTKAHLRKMGISENHISSLLTGKKLTLKQQASLEEVKRLSVKFKHCGLQTHVALKLNRNCLEAGLQFQAKREPPQPQSKAQWETVILPEKHITPALIGMPGESELTDEKNQTVGLLCNATYFWQPLALIVGLLITGVTCETYFVRLLSEILGLHLMATAIGLLLLGIAVFILPRFLQPLTGFSIKNSRSENSLVAEEQSVFYLSKRLYNIKMTDGRPVATVERKSSAATMELTEDLTLFCWDKAFTLANLGDNAVEDLQNELVQDEGIPFLPEHFHWLKRLKKIVSKKPSTSDINWNSEEGLVILDQDNTLKAIVYQEPIPAIRFRENIKSSHKTLLIVFAVCLLRSHLV